MTRTIAVAGPPGSGKTTRIARQAQELAHSKPLYGALGSADISLDGMFLASQCPQLEVISPLTPSAVMGAIAQDRPVFIEIDNSVDLAQLALPDGINLEKVGLLPPGWKSQGLEAWSDRILPTEVAFPEMPPPGNMAPAQICAIELTGQVFDPPSLDLLWQEVTGGAYGAVQRSKGVFCLADGSVFYFSYVEGHQSTYTQLSLEPCLAGRPFHPSAIQITGQDLNGKVILATTQDCLLSDELLQQHQLQLKMLLQQQKEEEKLASLA